MNPKRIGQIIIIILVIVAGYYFYSQAQGALTINKTVSTGTLSDGLIGHWTFDGADMVSNVADVSGNGNHGYLNGQTSTTTVPGIIGQALEFDGTDDYVKVPLSSSLPTDFVNTNDWTYSVWLKPSLSGDDSTHEIFIGRYHAPRIILTPSSGSIQLAGSLSTVYTTIINETGLVVADEWALVTVTSDGLNYRLYKDGAEVASAAYQQIDSGVSRYLIGGLDAANSYKGTMDDIRMYNRGLSADEVKQLYDSAKGSVVSKTQTPTNLSTGLTGWWTFDGSDMLQNVVDKSGQGNTGYLKNFTSTTTIIGKIGQALDFDGTDDYVNVGNDASLEPGAGDFSVSFWYKGVVAGEAQFIGTLEVGDYWNIKELDSGVGDVSVTFIASGIANVATFTLPDDNEWHHLVVILDRAPSKDETYAYLDGSQISISYLVQGLDGENIAPNKNVYISTWNIIGDLPRTGPMDDVRIYQRALSADEIKQLYDSTKGSVVNKTQTPINLSTGLVGHWTFDGPDMFSNIADVSGTGNTGYLQGQTATTTIIGKIGQALDFDGVDDSVTIDLDTSIAPGTGDFSVSFWYKGGNGVFIRQGYCSNGDTPCWFITDIQAHFNMDTLPFKQSNNDFTLPDDNEWHNLTVVLDRDPSPDTLVVYLDGDETGSQSQDSLDGQDLIPTNVSTYIGGWYIVDSSRTGPMDDVRIYQRALSADEIKQLYNMGR